jgi:hypothetical protein
VAGYFEDHQFRNYAFYVMVYMMIVPFKLRVTVFGAAIELATQHTLSKFAIVLVDL